MRSETSTIFKIVISIINYRTPDMTIECLGSVLADIEGTNGHIVVVDNASGDGSVAQLQSWLSAQPDDTPITLIQSGKNSGFSGGHNLAMSQYKADYYLILNSDSLLKPGFIKDILAAADRAPDVGLFAPTIEDSEGLTQVSCFRFHNPVSELIRGAGIGAVTKLLKRHEVPLFPPVNGSDIQWASFACVLIRRDVFDDIGAMDGGYFLYFEDCEFCHRARRHGWPIAQAPGARVLHYQGGSSPVPQNTETRIRLPRYYYEARTRYFYQTLGGSGLLAANGFWYIGRALSLVRYLALKPPHRAIVGEYRDIWANFFTPLKASKAP